MKKPGDWILLGFAIAASIPFIFANIVILIYRRRKYFQAQGGVDLIVIGSIAGLIWIASSFVANDHFTRKGFGGRCELWNLWLRITLGISLWLVCLTLRLHRMFLLSNGRRDLTCKHILLLPLMLLPSIILSLLASHLGAYETLKPCKLKSSWLYSIYFTVLPVYFSGMLIFLLLMRGNKDPVVTTEYKHTVEYSVMAFIIYLLSGETYITEGQHEVAGRCFLTFCVCWLVFVHFWVRMGWPVYLCLFKPESVMDEFEESLRRAGAGIFRVLSAVHNVPDDIQSSEGAVLHALQEVMEEVESVKIRVQKLETVKQDLLRDNAELLQAKNRKLAQTSSSKSSSFYIQPFSRSVRSVNVSIPV